VHPVTASFVGSLEVALSVIPESNCVDVHDAIGQRSTHRLPFQKWAAAWSLADIFDVPAVVASACTVPCLPEFSLRQCARHYIAEFR